MSSKIQVAPTTGSSHRRNWQRVQFCVVTLPLVVGMFVGLFANELISAPPQTSIGIIGGDFYLNGEVTYKGRSRNGHRVEGLLMNSRKVQAVFDDVNPETAPRWAYPGLLKIWYCGRNRTVRRSIPLRPKPKLPLGKPAGFFCGQLTCRLEGLSRVATA